MLRLAIAFLLIALVAALFGFNLVADFSFDVAKVIFFLFLVLGVLALLAIPFRRPV